MEVIGMARNTVTQQFRDNATDEQWKQLVLDHENCSDEDFRSKYGFSWNAIMNEAAEKGYYEKKRKYLGPTTAPVSSELLSFLVSPQPADIKKISRSVQLNEDIYHRLQTIEHDNGQYTRSSILNQLLDDALKKYGY